MATEDGSVTKLYTIGFTEKTAEEFFTLLMSAGVKSLIDVRLNNRSQLAGFSKASDLPYFLRSIAKIDYRHVPAMAPTQEMLDRYKKLKGSWAQYEIEFMNLIQHRNIAAGIRLPELQNACLLCSEHRPNHCHRRLVAEHLAMHFPGIEVVHLF